MELDVFQRMQRVLRGVMVARGVRAREVRVLDRPVHVYELEGRGTGPPVLLVHGLGGNANGFARLFFGLARRFRRVVAPDLPGHGFSPPSEPMNVRAQFEVLRAFAETRVGGPAFVVGNSLGGAMAVQLATESPQSVSGLALVAPAGAQVPAEELRAVLQAFDVRTPRQAWAMTCRLFHHTPLPFLLLSSQLVRFYGAPAVRALCAEAPSVPPLAPEALRGLQVPVLLLWGGSEKLLPPSTLAYFRQHLPPHAEVHVVKGFGHVPQVERPGTVVSHLVRFADRHAL